MSDLDEWVGDKRRVMVVEDDDFVRGLMSHAFSKTGFEVLALPGVVEATRAFGDFDPDALVVDIHLGPGPTGMDLAHSLQARSPGLAVLAVSNYPSAASAGVSGGLPDDVAFVCKSDLETPEVLLDALEAVLRNATESIVSTSVRESPLKDLTPVQVEVLRLMAAGWTNAEIAEQRGATQRSVEAMSHRIFSRLGVNDDPRKSPRVQAVKLYTQVFGVVQGDE